MWLLVFGFNQNNGSERLYYGGRVIQPNVQVIGITVVVGFIDRAVIMARCLLSGAGALPMLWSLPLDLFCLGI
jgi:hypothetical protein